MLIDDVIEAGVGSASLPDHIPFDVHSIWTGLPEVGWTEPMQRLLNTTPVRPPYPRTWFEWRNTDRVRAAQGYSATEITADEYRSRLRAILPGSDQAEADQTIADLRAAGATAYVWTDFYARALGRCHLLNVVILPVDERAMMIPIEADGGGYLTMSLGVSDGSEDYREQSSVLAWYAGFFLAMLHVRNVAVDDHEPDPAIQRARRHRHKQPLLQFKTLRVVTPGSLRQSESAPRAETNVVAFHLVRGHFAHYREDRPLFGKHAGTFWVPSHARGTVKAGAVIKDYALVPRTATRTAGGN